MSRPQNYALFILALSSAGLGWYCYQQNLEIVRLRAAGMSSVERSTWQKKVWALEKSQGGGSDASSTAKTDDQNEEGTGRADRIRGDRRGPNMAAMTALMNSPEFIKLLSTQQKGLIESRYAALFKKLNLTPAELDKFKSLIMDRQNAVNDVMTAAREQGLNGRNSRDQVRNLIEAAQAEVDASMRTLLGDQRYDQYQNYEATSSQRNTVSQLSSRLSYSQTPLTEAQTDQLVGLLSSDTSAVFPEGFGGPGGGRGMLGGGMGGESSALITATTLQQAQGILSQPQLAVLQSLYEEQQAQQQINKLMRSTFRPPNSTPGSASSAPTGGNPRP
jgi:hypothetical protein